MDILRNLLGSLTSGIIRLLVTVGIIAAVGFFLVKPALETTEKISRETNSSIENSFGGHGPGDLAGEIGKLDRQVQRQVKRAFHTVERGGSPSRLLRCVKRAKGDVQRIERCTVKF